MGVSGQRAIPQPLHPRERPGRLHGRSGQVRKILPPPGFDPRTVQPVASRYTDRANPAHPCEMLFNTICNALTMALHSINNQKNSERYSELHVMFFQCSQHQQLYSYMV